MPADARALLTEALFAGPELRAYAILDGARDPEMLPEIARLGVRTECLLPGDVAPEVWVAAPHLAPLSEGGPLFDWILSRRDPDWGVFVAARAEVLHVAAHFQALALASLPDGRLGYLRYYDPRVLRGLLPACDARQRAALFGETVVRFAANNRPDASPPILVFEA